MVLGYSLLPFAMGLLLQSPGMALSITPLVLLLNVAIVKLREEPDLEKRFGDEYRRYREKTPFLVPEPGRLYRGFVTHGLSGRRTQLLYVFIGLLILVVLGLLAFSPSVPRIVFGARWPLHPHLRSGARRSRRPKEAEGRRTWSEAEIGRRRPPS